MPPDTSTSRRRTLIAFFVFVFVVCLVAWGLYGSPIIPVPEPYMPGDGAKYAKKLARTAQGLSFVMSAGGWILVSIGGFLQMTAGVVGQKAKGDAAKGEENDTVFKVLRRQRGLLCSAVAIVSLGTGWQFLDRSSAASQVSSIATLAMVHTSADPSSDPCDTVDRKAYEACLRARASWLEGRMNHDRIQNILSNLSKTPGDKTPPNVEYRW